VLPAVHRRGDQLTDAFLGFQKNPPSHHYDEGGFRWQGNLRHSMLRKMKTILAAIDLSPITPKVLSGAAELATAFHGKLLLLTVQEPMAAYVPVGAAMDVITAPMPLASPDLEEVKERLEQLAAPLRAEGLDVETRAFSSLPVDEILDQAKRAGASMLVLGSHGHGALYHLFSGSVVTSVLQKATIPVTVIPVHGV
jgi:nucleotide-binding universal stress UspA family protein